MAAVAAKASAIIGSAVFCNISASTIETAIRNMWKKHSPELLINEAVLAKAGPEWTGLGTSFNLGWVAYTPFNNARNALWSAEQDRADACNQTKEINTAQQCNDAILAEKKASYRFNRTVKELNIYLVEMASYLTQLQGNVTSNVTKTEILNDFGLPPTP